MAYGKTKQKNQTTSLNLFQQIWLFSLDFASRGEWSKSLLLCLSSFVSCVTLGVNEPRSLSSSTHMAWVIKILLVLQPIAYRVPSQLPFSLPFKGLSREQVDTTKHSDFRDDRDFFLCCWLLSQPRGKIRIELDDSQMVCIYLQQEGKENQPVDAVRVRTIFTLGFHNGHVLQVSLISYLL